MAGHPGSTSRLETVAQLETERDVEDPMNLKVLKDRIAALKRYSAQGDEQACEAESQIFYLENSLKAIDGRYQGLLDSKVMAKKQRDERDLRSKVMANPEWKAAYGGAWDAIADVERKAASRIQETYLHRLNSEFATIAMNIVEYVAEIRKPDGERLPGFPDAQLDSLKFRMFSPAPIYRGLEMARIVASLEQLRAEMGPNDPFLKLVLKGRTPEQAASELVNGTKLADPAARKMLVEAGEPALRASTDPMIVLARELDPMRRELIRWTQDNIESIGQRAGEQLGAARFAVYGKTAYPDATFTLRLSYGQVKGYPMNGTQAPSKTTFYGLYDRAASFNFDGPFALPPRYREGRAKLDLGSPLDFVTTNDVTGGNSGSPVINREGEIVGLIFDGNIESLVGDLVYQEETNRSVAVARPAAMTDALRQLYNAPTLVNELLGR